MEWLEENKSRISIEYLPPYSPELNPDEYLNQDVKASLTGKMRMNDNDDLEQQVTDFMNHRMKNRNQVKREYPIVCVNDFLWLFEAEGNLVDAVK
jgi:hypothetical protein